MRAGAGWDWWWGKVRRAAGIVRCISAIWKAKSESISMDQVIASCTVKQGAPAETD